MSKKTDEAVIELLVKVQKKKEEIKAAKKKPQWKTNCSFGLDPESSHDRKNIQVEKSPKRLVNWYAFLTKIEEDHEKAAAELGLSVDLTWLNYSIVDWKEDLKSRAAQLSIDQKQAEIDILDKRVNKLVSPDQRREMELEALQRELR